MRTSVRVRRAVRQWQWGLVCALALTGQAGAHSFRVGFVSPGSGPDAIDAAQARAGFMLATTERDAHPGETADGHLGGLDVYVEFVDSELGLERIRRTVARLAHQGGLDVVTGVMTDAVVRALTQALKGSSAVVLAPSDALVNRPLDPDFAANFRAYHGSAATSAAQRGYCLAQIVDRAVRDLAGDFSSRDRVTAAFASTDCQL